MLNSGNYSSWCSTRNCKTLSRHLKCDLTSKDLPKPKQRTICQLPCPSWLNTRWPTKFWQSHTYAEGVMHQKTSMVYRCLMELYALGTIRIGMHYVKRTRTRCWLNGRREALTSLVTVTKGKATSARWLRFKHWQNPRRR